jgi:hypothetical protein
MGAELVFGELKAANTGLRCCPCTDQNIADGGDPGDVPAAVTLAPVMQTFAMGGQQVMGVVNMPVCYKCRSAQLKPLSKTGLVTA